MPSSFLPSHEPLTKKNYQLETKSNLVPLKDEKNSTVISIPTIGFKKAYTANEFDHMMAPKVKSDQLDEEETMPNFIFHLNDDNMGDLMPKIR